jgi:hypothetical protein
MRADAEFAPGQTVQEIQHLSGGRVRVQWGTTELTVSRDRLRRNVDVSTSARHTDPNTSHQAARRAAHSAVSNSDMCLIAHAEAGTRGLNGDELEAKTGRPYQTIGPRRPDLERAGYVEQATTADGVPIERNNKQVYRITDAGHREATRIKREIAA